MNISVFKFTVVSLAPFKTFEIPHVLCGEYLVLAESMDEAFSKIRLDSSAAEASEVWGQPYLPDDGILLTPGNATTRRMRLTQHHAWVASTRGVTRAMPVTTKPLDELVRKRMQESGMQTHGQLSQSQCRERSVP